MHVTQIHLFHYPLNEDWRVEAITDVNEIAIETAVLRLDRTEFPYLWLLTEWDEDDVPDDFMAITGGDGEYRITHYSRGDEHNYLDNARTMENYIEICPGSIMGSQPERYLCSNTDLAISIAKYFARTGKRTSGVDWS